MALPRSSGSPLGTRFTVTPASGAKARTAPKHNKARATRCIVIGSVRAFHRIRTGSDVASPSCLMSFAVRGVARAAVRQRRWSCASARWSGLSKPRVAAPSTRVAWLSTVPTPGSSASASQVEEARATQALGRYGNMLLRLLGYYSEEPTRLRAADALFRSCAERASGC